MPCKNFLVTIVLMAMTALSGAARAADDKPVPIPFTVALLQLTPDGPDVEANAAKAERYCRQAAQQGADLVLMPEMWSIGYTHPKKGDAESFRTFRSWAVERDSAYVARFKALAKELDIAIAATYLERYEPEPRNTVTLFDRHGNEVFTYAKVHTSDFKHMEVNMTPGDQFFTGNLDTRRGNVRIGAMICFDREQPESARILMLQGAEIIITPNACVLDELRVDQFKIRAFENIVGVAMANYAGSRYKGRSVAFMNDGKCLVEAGAAEGLYLAQFDLAALRADRAKRIWGNAYRRPHRYQALISTEKQDLWNRLDGNEKPYNATAR